MSFSMWKKKKNQPNQPVPADGAIPLSADSLILVALAESLVPEVENTELFL